MRKTRMLEKLARYHVTARVNNREFLMGPDRAKVLFEEVLLRARQRFTFKIDNFVIMDNHFHMIIKPGEHENLSRIMQWILSVYAMSYNRLTGRSGHFWGDRFFSRILVSLEQYLKVFKYIDENPSSATMQFSSEWPYSGQSHRRRGLFHLVERIPPFVQLALQEITIFI